MTMYSKESQLVDQVLQRGERESSKDSMVDRISDRQDSLRLKVSVLFLSL